MQAIGLGSENIDYEESENKFNRINVTNQAPKTFRASDVIEEMSCNDDTPATNQNGFSSTLNRKKSDLRYQIRESHIDQEYALEFEQERDMFDEFLNN